MLYTQSEAVDFIFENDVKFIRLAFCDVFGVQKNVSIMPCELEAVFRDGFPFDASAVRGFGDEAKSDLILFPDPATLSLLPWRPSHGRVVRFFCDIKYPDGTPFELDGRHILRQAVARARQAGLTFAVSTESEFYLLRTDDEGHPLNIPFDTAGYLDIAPADKGENVRREICLTLEEMGLCPESSHHGAGPGQNGIDFHAADPLTCADNTTTFRSVVSTIAARNGLYASFAPKPFADQSGNGMHINLLNAAGDRLPDSFVAGVLAHVSEITAFLNPTEQSYARLGRHKAPGHVAWSRQNRSQLIRIPHDAAGHERMELRSPDTTANPYLAIALVIDAGLDGVAQGLPLCEPLNVHSTDATAEQLTTLRRLPQSYEEAFLLASESAFVHRLLPERLLHVYRHPVPQVV